MEKKVVAAVFMCAVLVLVVAAPLALAATHSVFKDGGAPRANAATWEYTPPGFGTWKGKIVNDGLRQLTVDVYDSTGGMMDQVSHQAIKFAEYPSNNVDTKGTVMSPHHVYSITVTPSGSRGTSCTVSDSFMLAASPIAVIELVFQKHLTLFVTGSDSSDGDGTIASYEWDFGDGIGATTMDVVHTYSAGGTYNLTLTVTDNDGFADTSTSNVAVSANPVASSEIVSLNGLTVSLDGSGSGDYDRIVDGAWTASGPWVMTGSGATYHSATGALWDRVGTPNLETGDRIVDVDVSIGAQGGDIFLATSTGRTYYWVPGTSTQWTAGEINPIDVATYSNAVSMSFYQSSGAWLLTKDGSYFWLMDAHKSGKNWTYQALAASGVTDFTDLEYEGGTMYALRSGPNTDLLYSNNGNFFTSVTNLTGSTSPQSELTYLPGASGSADDRVFVLCKNGDIRYSADGGQTWSALGNLPRPTGMNASKYVGIGIDPSGYMWTATDTGYCYVSTDSTTYASFDYAGKVPISSIVSWNWNWGDGTTGSGMTATHTYAAAGTYTVTLTVMDNDGSTGSKSMQVTVVAPEPPVAAFSVVNDFLNMSVDASDSNDPDGAIVSYAWTFGDGGIATGMVASYTYAAAGTYTVSLTVTDNDGLVGMATKVVTVSAYSDQNPVASFEIVSVNGLMVSVNGSGSDDNESVVSGAWTASGPWVMTGSGATYQSATGALWDHVGTPNLETGDRIVDIDMSIGSQGGHIFLVTNTGRTYYWIPGTSTQWTAGEINPIDVATYSDAVSMSFYQNSGAWLLTENGSYFWLMDAHKSGKNWTYQALAASGVTDFADLEYEGGTMYALRSGPNTGLSYSNNGNFFISLTSPTGSTSPQSELTYLPGASGSADDRVFVLCENGDIRYSADGGQTWSAWGNLPRPTGMNASKYVGIGIDPSGYMWTATDTGYCYVSTDSTTYASFRYTGKVPIGGIVSWNWNWGDGTTGTGKTATHTYATAGTKTITLTVTDNNGMTGTTSHDVVVSGESQSPVAAFTATMTYLSVSVDASASFDPGGSISTYAWTWGDGTTGTGKTATHSYAIPGVKTITLVVTDNSGLTGTVSHDVTAVNPPQPPVAAFTYTVNYLAVSVDASGSSDPDGTISSYAWTWGDGATGTGMTATHTYATAGTKTITLTVTDNSGMTGTVSHNVSVSTQPQPPVGVFTATVTYLSVSVDASASSDPDGTISTYAWTWGDGTTGTGTTATHTYATPGVKTITLVVTDNSGMTGTISHDVTAVNPPQPPVAAFTTTMTYLNISVDASASSDPDGTISSYAWTWGDGTTESGRTATHAYATPGVKTITLVVTDNSDMTGTVSHNVTAVLPPQPPVAAFTYTVNYLVVSVDASGSSDPDGTISSYVWTWGDGAAGTGKTAAHTYAAAGTKTITLVVTDNSGLTGTVSHDVPVSSQPQPPVAVFTPTVTFLNVSVNASASFDPDGTISTYAWTWGDGTTGTGKTATHTYATAGTKTITLVVTDNSGLTGTASQIVTAVSPPQPPVAAFTLTVNYLAVSVDASGSSDLDGTISSYAWTWGDGTTGTGKTATHTYATAGTKTITLVVTDNSGMTGTVSHDVIVATQPQPPVAAFTATMTYLNVSVDAAASSDADGTITTYAWTWGDGTTGTGKTATHTYATAGTRTITLVVTDNSGLTGMISHDVTVVNPPQPPVAAFTATMAYLRVSVDASGSSDPDGTISTYAWTWGDGTTGTGKTATHTYATAGTKTITLMVIDNSGMTSAVSHDVQAVLPPAPTASFTFTVSGMSVSVDASTSTGTGLTYAWSWGDGATGSGATATHIYTDTTMSAMDNSVSGKAPPVPHPIYGFTWAADGVTPLTDCLLTFRNVNNGKSFTYHEEPGQNSYVVDASMFGDSGYANGDIINVTATVDSYIGWVEYPINMANDMDGPWDIILHSSESVPFDVTITLTVTDMYGRTATISRTVTITP